MNKPKVIVVAGPTAVGKTEYALRIAEALNGEIVSCDSMQLYRGMDIGSVSPSADELARVPHHLISVVDPREGCSAARYQAMATQAIEAILARGRQPIVAGGTGLYLHALLFEMDFGVVQSDPVRRRELEEIATKEGGDVLFQRLAAIDPAAADRIHPHNIKRVIRAIEAAERGEGLRPIGAVKKQRRQDYDFLLMGLARNRQELYARIDQRVQVLADRGLATEVQHLLDMGLTKDDTAMKGIGYKEIIPYLEGRCSFTEALQEVAKNTRHYAKRQMTWFRKYETMHWFSLSSIKDEETALGEMLTWLKENM